jgi:diaminohydroxyphosphoribosylaminopyrimidine deaminase/5-amino-6-(5-phosphoribosylamino)uracil reductase
MRLLSSDAASIPDPFLRRAYELAELGVGSASPNPVVGCVLVREGRIVGEGFHSAAGGPHAEVVALDDAVEKAQGATAYVTLEPCNHHGRTPPCAPALVAAGVSAVVVGMRDPDPSVAGGGVEALRAGGVDVRLAEDATPFERLNAPWVHFVTTGLPWVRAKVAVTLDGRVALRAGGRSRLTNDGGLVTQRARAAADVVMVGVSTLEIDRPRLTARDESGARLERQPRRAVLARSTLPSAEAVDAMGPGGDVLLLAPGALATPGTLRGARSDVRAVPYDADEGLRGVLEALSVEGIRHVLVEPGPRLLTALWDAGSIEQLVLVHAGGMGGKEAPALYEGAGPLDPEQLAASMRSVEAAQVGGDAATVWEPV